MTDLRINNFNKTITSPQFRANENVTKPIELDEKKGLSSGAKWAIGTGLAILGTYGIYLATRGKVKPKANPKPTPTPPTTGQNNPVQEIKNFALDVFKKEGKFDKGRAILSDGTKYTGNITAECKTDGSKVVMEYVDGVLQKSTKTAKDGTKVFDKTYTYADDGLIKEIKKNGETILDENKLIEIYKKVNTKLIQDEHNALAVKYPNLIKNLEEIYVDVAKIENTSLKECIVKRLEKALSMFRYKYSDKGKIIRNMPAEIKLEDGLINLRNQNKSLHEFFSKKTPFDEEYKNILMKLQDIDEGLLDKSLVENSSVKNLKRKISKTLEDLGYKFENYGSKTENLYDIEKINITTPELVNRAIVDKNGKCILKGKVYVPMNF